MQEAADAAEGLARLDPRATDVVLLDINLPGLDGLDALERIREQAPVTAVIMVTGEATVANAMRAGQRGAYDFIEKPPDLPHLLGVVAEAGHVARLRRRPAAPPGEPELGIVGQSAALQAVLEQARRIAPSQGRVLITGESGSGKELFAYLIHALSKRADGPFVKLNCAAIPRDLLESELFGYERGAFTGAVTGKKGRLELADQGTLFLDEVGDLSLEAQAKLLRAIETGEVERLGGTKTAHVDVRIVAATHKDLAAAVPDGEFREDLYYRLNVLPIHVPPLRERRGDPALLAGHFLATFCRAEEKTAEAAEPRGPARAGALPLAGQRARAAQPHGARRRPRAGRGDPRRGPAALARERVRPRGDGGTARRDRAARGRRHPQGAGGRGLERDAGRGGPRDRPHEPAPQDAQVRHQPPLMRRARARRTGTWRAGERVSHGRHSAPADSRAGRPGRRVGRAPARAARGTGFARGTGRSYPFVEAT